jgi:hypothetical protein
MEMEPFSQEKKTIMSMYKNLGRKYCKEICSKYFKWPDQNNKLCVICKHQ